MIRLHFTPPDSDDAWDAWIADGRAAVARMLAGAADRRAIDAALYKRQRDRLLMVTHQKCAYCELRLPAGQRKGDVEHYRPLLSAYMSRYDYDDDWTLESEPVVRAEECSEYVMRLVRERRQGFPASVA